MSEEKEKGVDPEIYVFHGSADGGAFGTTLRRQSVNYANDGINRPYTVVDHFMELIKLFFFIFRSTQTFFTMNS